MKKNNSRRERLDYKYWPGALPPNKKRRRAKPLTQDKRRTGRLR